MKKNINWQSAVTSDSKKLTLHAEYITTARSVVFFQSDAISTLSFHEKNGIAISFFFQSKRLQIFI